MFKYMEVNVGLHRSTVSKDATRQQMMEIVLVAVFKIRKLLDTVLYEQTLSHRIISFEKDTS